MKRTITTLAAMLLALSMVAMPASAYTLDDDGTGFVGKGEVQSAFNWNNRVVQNNADAVSFQYESVTETETTWECRNANNQNIQERERTTTTTTQGVLNSIARERNQVTGFNLIAFIGEPTTTTTSTGNQFQSCPSGPWSFVPDSTETSEPEVISGGLYAVFGTQRELL